MNHIELYYINEEEDRQRKHQLKLERQWLRERLAPGDLPDREFRRLFRVNKELFQTLMDELTPLLDHGRRATRLSIETRLLAALRFFATGSYQKGIGEERNVGIAQQTMSKTITEVALALETLAARYITFPQTAEARQRVQQGFMDKFAFPGVIGCIDGTHVAILQPMEDEHIYFNRKGFHSKNVQLICDADLLILNVNSNFGGAAHDAFIWRSSAIYTLLEATFAQQDNERLWLIGDSGYPLQPWLMTPITNTIEGTPERRYDDALKTTRNCIERCIGVLKNRWRCLLQERVLRYTPYKAGVIINACCVLHNLCIRGNVPLDEELQEEDAIPNAPIHIEHYFPQHILNAGRRQRQTLIDLYFAHEYNV